MCVISKLLRSEGIYVFTYLLFFINIRTEHKKYFTQKRLARKGTLSLPENHEKVNVVETMSFELIAVSCYI